MLLFKFAVQDQSPVFILFQNLPLSRGNSHISSTDPELQPTIDPQSFSPPLDIEIMAQHMQTLLRLTASPPMTTFLEESSQDISSVDAVNAYLRDNMEPAYHACGTAAMLPLERGGVVDERLIIYGTRNLRVVDTSIFPRITTAVPMATVYAVAERMADIIRRESSIYTILLGPSSFLSTFVVGAWE